MQRRSHELGRYLARTLAVLALGLLGCPQLLADDFLTAEPDGYGEEPGAQAGAGAPGASGAGSGGASSSSGSGGAGSAGAAGQPTGSGEAGSLPDAGGPTAAPPDGGPPACVAATESCDGRDNDCDELIDEAPACAADCVGLVIEGRSGMLCVGSGATFANAESRCLAQGMRPVVIDSAQKSAAVLQAIEPPYAGLSAISEAQKSIWVDAHDDEVEGTWHWGSSGTIFWQGDATGSAQNGAYANWAAGKPNDSGGDEDCAVMHVGSGADPAGTWNDDSCAGLHAFLCEASAP